MTIANNIESNSSIYSHKKPHVYQPNPDIPGWSEPLRGPICWFQSVCVYNFIYIYMYTHIQYIYIYIYMCIMYIYIYIYTSQSVIWNRYCLALPQLSFSTAMPMLSQFHLQSSGLLWVVTMWHVHSPRPVSPLVSCLATQAGTCSAGITHPLNLREGKTLLVAPREDPR